MIVIIIVTPAPMKFFCVITMIIIINKQLAMLLNNI